MGGSHITSEGHAGGDEQIGNGVVADSKRFEREETQSHNLCFKSLF